MIRLLVIFTLVTTALVLDEMQLLVVVLLVIVDKMRPLLARSLLAIETTKQVLVV